MADLKPCPFCGRIPVVEDCGQNRYFVRCKCGIAQDKLYGQRCDAVRRWNKRKGRGRQEEPKKETKTNKKLDHGKICALRKAGWPVSKIADEMGCSGPTVRYHLDKEGIE